MFESLHEREKVPVPVLNKKVEETKYLHAEMEPENEGDWREGALIAAAGVIDRLVELDEKIDVEDLVHKADKMIGYDAWRALRQVDPPFVESLPVSSRAKEVLAALQQIELVHFAELEDESLAIVRESPT